MLCFLSTILICVAFSLCYPQMFCWFDDCIALQLIDESSSRDHHFCIKLCVFGGEQQSNAISCNPSQKDRIPCSAMFRCNRRITVQSRSHLIEVGDENHSDFMENHCKASVFASKKISRTFTLEIRTEIGQFLHLTKS